MSAGTLEKPRSRRRNGAFPSPDPPPLQNGDHLTRDEFERRYAAMPRLKKAELIEGVVIMASPVTAAHAAAQMAINGLLFFYAAGTPGVSYGDNATIRLDADNEVQPDGLLRIEPAAGGKSRLARDGYYDGPPELILEIAYSTVAHDLHEKFKMYRRNKVPEYLVWQIQEERLECFAYRSGKYANLPVEGGVIRSHVFPGLWLDAK